MIYQHTHNRCGKWARVCPLDGEIWSFYLESSCPPSLAKSSSSYSTRDSLDHLRSQQPKWPAKQTSSYLPFSFLIFAALSIYRLFNDSPLASKPNFVPVDRCHECSDDSLVSTAQAPDLLLAKINRWWIDPLSLIAIRSLEWMANDDCKRH